MRSRKDLIGRRLSVDEAWIEIKPLLGPRTSTSYLASETGIARVYVTNALASALIRGEVMSFSEGRQAFWRPVTSEERARYFALLKTDRVAAAKEMLKAGLSQGEICRKLALHPTHLVSIASKLTYQEERKGKGLSETGVPNWEEIDDLLGKMPDSSISSAYAVPVHKVKVRRTKLGIPSFRETKKRAEQQEAEVNRGKEEV